MQEIPTFKAFAFVIFMVAVLGSTFITNHESLMRTKERPSPTSSPTASPTASPTTSPTLSPTVSPTLAPTASPTLTPTVAPGSPSVAPTATPTPAPGGSNIAVDDDAVFSSKEWRSPTFWFYYGMILLAVGIGVWALCSCSRMGGFVGLFTRHKSGSNDNARERTSVHVHLNGGAGYGQGYEQAPGDVYALSASPSAGVATAAQKEALKHAQLHTFDNIDLRGIQELYDNGDDSDYDPADIYGELSASDAVAGVDADAGYDDDTGVTLGKPAVPEPQPDADASYEDDAGATVAKPVMPEPRPTPDAAVPLMVEEDDDDYYDLDLVGDVSD